MDDNFPTGETMNEGGPMPPLPGGRELPVPLGALAQPDDAERMVTPEPGDAVTLTVEAKLVRVEGQTAFIEVTAVNGETLGGESAAPAGEPDGDEAEASALRQMAGGM